MTDIYSFHDLDQRFLPGDIALLRRSHQSGLYSIAIHGETSKESQQIAGPEWAPQGPRYSPDGKSLAFFGNGRLCIYDSVANAVYSVLDQPDLSASFCEWSPDGKQLVFSAFPPPGTRTQPGQGPDIYLLDVSTKTARQLTADFAVNRFPQWVGGDRHDDSLFVVFHRQNPPRAQTPKKIVLLNINTGQEILLPSNPEGHCQASRFCGSPDGRYVVYSEKGAAFTGIHVFDITNAEIAWSIEHEGPYSAAFSPQGNALVLFDPVEKELLRYSFPDRKRLARLSLAQETFEVAQTLTGPVWVFPVDSENNESILFLGTDSRLYRWRTDEENCTMLSAPSGTLFPDVPKGVVLKEELYESISRDGRRTPVHQFTPQNAKRLAILFVHGGPPASGTPEAAAASHFTRDLLLRTGYEIIVPAYRGMDENEGEYGRADLWDVLDAARDWHGRHGKGRPLAIVGYSYGGYLTLCALTLNEQSLLSRGAALWPVTHPFGLHLPRWFPAGTDELAKTERLPAEQAETISVPLLLLSGGRDRISTDPMAVSKIEQSLTRRNIPHKIHTFADDTHGLPRNRAEADTLLLDFLAREDAS